MTPSPDSEELYFLPLGGTGEIGMNLNLYGYGDAWLMIDLGVTFSGSSLPGVEVLMPDPAFIEERRDSLIGLVLTHAHEDHIGAVPHLWPRLRCPIYATAFTAAMLESKLEEAGLLEEAEVQLVPLSGGFSVGPFELELITLTHSIPEPNAVVLRTPAGTVLHTGDWKLDPDPVVGETFDEVALRKLAEEGVLAMVCDSTNALVEGDSGSEAEVSETLMALMGRFENRVAVACFASNVARLQTIFRAAQAHGRRVALIGRSMHRIFKAAVETGYLTDLPQLVSEKEVGYLPPEEVLLLCTGSQGETRAALWRIAQDEHNHVTLEAGDAVIFSSRVIPGNEKAIFDLQNLLARRGIEVVTDEDYMIHVSGHPAREELTQMYQWVRPRIAIPVHGEARHLMEHAELARDCQVPQAIVSENGSLIRLAPGPAQIVEQVHSGRLAVDGTRLVPLRGSVLRGRSRLANNGAALATLVINGDGRLISPPRLSTQGLMDDAEVELAEADLVEAVHNALGALRRSDLKDDALIGEAARIAIRRAVFRLIGKKPITQVHVVRLP